MPRPTLHPSLLEVDPQPKAYADIIRIEVIFPIREDVVGGDGQEEIRINGEIVFNEPLEANPWPENQGGIIFADAGVDKFSAQLPSAPRCSVSVYLGVLSRSV